MIPTLEPKAPGERLMYAVDWSLELAERALKPLETITQAGFQAEGMEIENTATEGGMTTFWVKAGEEDTNATATVTITTSTGRELQQTITIPIRRR